MRPVVVHPRMDFMFYAFDPIINEAANWYYMNGGRLPVPVVFWGIINRGGEQAAQHSQSLHGMFAHVPGLKVVMPASPCDAKGLMVAAIRDQNPVVFIDDRWLYRLEEPVPEEIYAVEIGRARIARVGTDVTITASSFMVQESLRAAELLAREGIETEVIDLRTIKPLDEEALIASVKKTGRIVVADGGWRSFGVAAEIAALAAERAFSSLRAPVARVTLPDCPAPASAALENAYYRKSTDIIQAVRGVL